MTGILRLARAVATTWIIVAFAVSALAQEAARPAIRAQKFLTSHLKGARK